MHAIITGIDEEVSQHVVVVISDGDPMTVAAEGANHQYGFDRDVFEGAVQRLPKKAVSSSGVDSGGGNEPHRTT